MFANIRIFWVKVNSCSDPTYAHARESFEMSRMYRRVGGYLYNFNPFLNILIFLWYTFIMEIDITKNLTATELSKVLGVTPQYISQQKKKLKSGGAVHGKRYRYREACAVLGYDPDNPQPKLQSGLQKAVSKSYNPVDETAAFMAQFAKGQTLGDNLTICANIDEAMGALEEKSTPKRRPRPLPTYDSPEDYEESKDLLEQILQAVKSPATSRDPVILNGLKSKASILAEYHKAKNEELKHRKQIENLFNREEIVRILNFLASTVRNTLINLPNNYAVNLEGMTQKQIKDYVTEDVNKILEQIQRTGEQFKDVN